ncbi:hypothetical protein Hdeb2414_s0008g00270341 [Helianthus debilis subsp. tardiflorus]
MLKLPTKQQMLYTKKSLKFVSYRYILLLFNLIVFLIEVFIYANFELYLIL